MSALIETASVITLNFVLKTGVDELIALGVRNQYRGAKDVKRVQERYVAQAEEIGRDAFRLGRSDRNGTALPDSGRLMFGHEKAVGGAFSFGNFVTDLVLAGFFFADINLLREDHRDRLFVNFSREFKTRNLPTEHANAIHDFLNGWWCDLQGFRNPDGRWNMNVSGRLQSTAVASTADKKIVRMDKDGVFRLIQVREPATKPAADATTQAADQSAQA